MPVDAKEENEGRVGAEGWEGGFPRPWPSPNGNGDSDDSELGSAVGSGFSGTPEAKSKGEAPPRPRPRPPPRPEEVEKEEDDIRVCLVTLVRLLGFGNLPLIAEAGSDCTHSVEEKSPNNICNFFFSFCQFFL